MNWCMIKALLIGCFEVFGGIVLLGGVMVLSSYIDKQLEKRLWYAAFLRKFEVVSNFFASGIALMVLVGVIFVLAENWYAAHCGM